MVVVVVAVMVVAVIVVVIVVEVVIDPDVAAVLVSKVEFCLWGFAYGNVFGR